MNGMYLCCTSTWPVNKQVLALTLFFRNSSRRLWGEASHTIDCSIKKQPISTAVVLEFIELLKWITKSYWTLASYLNVSIFVIVIGSFFIFRSGCFIIPKSLSYWLIKKFICSTVLHTFFVLFASQLTAALPFSMRTSSHIKRNTQILSSTLMLRVYSVPSWKPEVNLPKNYFF